MRGFVTRAEGNLYRTYGNVVSIDIDPNARAISIDGLRCMWSATSCKSWSPPGAGAVWVGVQGDGDLVGWEVKLAALAEDPTSFDS